MKLGPEELRARFRRSVTMLGGSGGIHAVVLSSVRCDRTGVRDSELVTMIDVARNHTWHGHGASDRDVCFSKQKPNWVGLPVEEYDEGA